MDTYNLQLYDHLLQFPLFQGLSRAELLQMAGNTKFGFLKVAPGKPIVSDGELCTQLFFLIGGTLTLITRSDDHGYSIVEPLSAPWLLQPEALFGLSPRFSCTAMAGSEACGREARPGSGPRTADTASHFITLSKDEMLRLLDDFLIIRLNFLNIMATVAQRRSRQAWHRSSPGLRSRIVRFLTEHCAYPAGPKTVNILMERLAMEMNDSRRDVSQVLNAMQAESLLTLHRGKIEIPSLERLFM